MKDEITREEKEECTNTQENNFPIEYTCSHSILTVTVAHATPTACSHSLLLAACTLLLLLLMVLLVTHCVAAFVASLAAVRYVVVVVAAVAALLVVLACYCIAILTFLRSSFSPVQVLFGDAHFPISFFHAR